MRGTGSHDLVCCVWVWVSLYRIAALAGNRIPLAAWSCGPGQRRGVNIQADCRQGFRGPDGNRGTILAAISEQGGWRGSTARKGNAGERYS